MGVQAHPEGIRCRSERPHAELQPLLVTDECQATLMRCLGLNIIATCIGELREPRMRLGLGYRYYFSNGHHIPERLT